MTDRAPRTQLIGELRITGEAPQQAVFTGVERRIKALCTVVDATTYTVIDGDEILLVDDDTAAGAVTITLPAAAAALDRILRIKKLGSTGNVVIDGDSAETIDGSTTLTLTTQYQAATIVSDGTEWWTL